MDHLAEAKNELEVSEGAEHHWQQLYLQSAQAHALIAIAELMGELVDRLHPFPACPCDGDVLKVRDLGPLPAGRKIDFGGEP